MEVKEHKGFLDAKGKSFAIVVGRFNEFITKALLAGALDCLERHNAASCEVFWCFGAFEIPPLARLLALSKKYDGIICLGAIIRGDTPHSEYIANETTKGIAKVYYETGVPTSFGIITAESLEQAIERAGTKEGNKGFIAALSVIEMADLKKRIGLSK